MRVETYKVLETLQVWFYAFWNTKGVIRQYATITEFIFVNNSIGDGTYFLNLQIAPFENDASPSRPVLYKTEE